MTKDKKRALKELLFDTYDGFADKRLKNLDNEAEFIIDDRGSGDIGADKKLYSYFCMMFAGVEAPHAVRVRLLRNVPQSKSVSRWSSRHKAEYTDRSLIFTVTPDTVDKLDDLADAFRSIVAPGARYDVPNYKYVCPRIAKSLDKLARILRRHWAAK